MALPSERCSGGQYKAMGPLTAAHTDSHTTTVMKSAVIILSMVAVIAAEAPYHLPRPTAYAPSLSYPAGTPPQPQPHPRPLPHFIQYPSQPVIAPQFSQGPGYHYQQPNIAPTFLQPAPQPQPHFNHPPAPQPIPVGPSHPLIPYPPQQFAQPQPQHIPHVQPSFTYGQPQVHSAPAPRPEFTVQPQPAFIAPQPQPQPAPVYQPISYYQPQVNSQQGYAYQQPQAQAVQYTSQLPLQAQPSSNTAASSALSSYQADLNQYSGGTVQTHSEALDSTVVNRVQNIIKDNEHTSAKNAGYLSLVSGVSLEGARPSIEISSFVQNSPLSSSTSEHSSEAQSSSSQSSTASDAASGPSQDYGFPTATANRQAPQVDASLVFLPQNKPATSYGSP